MAASRHTDDSLWGKTLSHSDFSLANTFFKVLLAFKLDHDIVLSYMNIFTPLHVCLFTLMFSSCSGRGGNKWWFGMRTDFCSALLKCLPCLTIYGNIYIGEKVRILIEFKRLTYFIEFRKLIRRFCFRSIRCGRSPRRFYAPKLRKTLFHNSNGYTRLRSLPK